MSSTELKYLKNEIKHLNDALKESIEEALDQSYNDGRQDGINDTLLDIRRRLDLFSRIATDLETYHFDNPDSISLLKKFIEACTKVDKPEDLPEHIEGI